MLLTVLCLLAAWSRAGDPLGVDVGLGSQPGRLIPMPGEALSPLTTQLPAHWRGQPLSLAQLSVLALRNNPQTRAAWERLRAQVALLGEAKSAWWPTLDLDATLGTSGSGGSFNNNASQTAIKPNLSLSWLVWDFGQTQARVALSRASLNAAVFTQNAAVQALLTDVQRAYYQLLGDQALLQSYQQTLASAENALQAAQAKHRAGQATIADVYQARAAEAAARAVLAAARQTVASDRGVLAAAIGLPLDVRLQLAPLDLHQPPQLTDSVQALMKQALSVNPALQSSRLQVSAAQAQLLAAQRSGRPTLSFGAQQGWLFQRRQSTSPQYSLGLTLTVPLFTGYLRDYQTAQARALLAEARANLQAGVQSTQLGVWRAYYAFLSATSALPNARAQLDNARKALDAVQAQYRVGLATMQDLLAAQAAVTSARVAQTRDAIDSYQALASLSAAIGTLSPPEGDLNAN